MKSLPIAAAIILFCAGLMACTDHGLERHEPPTPMPTPEPSKVYLNWASQVCGFAPSFEDAISAWDEALASAMAADFEAIRDELLHLVSFNLQSTTSSMSQWLGFLATAQTSSMSAWLLPPGVTQYDSTLFQLFRDFEPVLNYAEADIRRAQTLDDLEAVHSTVGAAEERMLTAVRAAAASLGPEALQALRSVKECEYFLAPPH